MDLIKKLQEDQSLNDFICPHCEDEGIIVKHTNEVDIEKILVIKVDDYYNSLHLKTPPPSIDCLIIQYCKETQYKVYLVELKNIKRITSINKKNIEDKFDTTLFDFMSDRFRDHFFDENINLKLQLILSAGKVMDSTIKTHRLDFLLGLKLFRFQGKLIGINGVPPHPLIHPC